jgi:hypothetical protein
MPCQMSIEAAYSGGVYSRQSTDVTNESTETYRKVCIIPSGTILYRHGNSIISESSLAHIILLEIERSFREPVEICNVMDGVDDVERVDLRNAYVIRRCRNAGIRPSVVESVGTCLRRGSEDG